MTSPRSSCLSHRFSYRVYGPAAASAPGAPSQHAKRMRVMHQQSIRHPGWCWLVLVWGFGGLGGRADLLLHRLSDLRRPELRQQLPALGQHHHRVSIVSSSYQQLREELQEEEEQQQQ